MAIKIVGTVTTFCMIFISSFCIAQKTVIDDNLQWFQYNNELKFSEKYSLCSDLNWVRSTDYTNESLMWIRAGIGYHLADNLNGTTGLLCGYLTTSKLNLVEHTEYQDVSSTQFFGAVAVQNRLRIEARYIEAAANSEIKPASTFFVLFRYELLTAIPVCKLSKTKPEKKLFLNIGDEVFFNAGKDIVYNTFDSNRLILGSTVQFNNLLQLSLVYIYQNGNLNAPLTYESTNILALAVTQKIALKQKTKSL